MHVYVISLTVLLLLAGAIGCTSAQAQFLQLITANARLPSFRSESPAFFVPPQNSIYVLGGRTPDSSAPALTEVVKYSISTDTIRVIGQLPTGSRDGTAAWVPTTSGFGSGALYYFGGGRGNGREIWRLQISFDGESLSEPEQIGQLPEMTLNPAAMWDGGDSVYIIGGTGTDAALSGIRRFNISSQTITQVGSIPGGLWKPAGVWVRGDSGAGKAYLFGGVSEIGNSERILVFDTSLGTVTTLPVSISIWSLWDVCPGWVSSSAQIGILPGEFNFVDGDFVANLVHFNTTTHSLTRTPVLGLPIYYQQFGCTYIPSLNRIYLFGGTYFGSDSSASDQIHYIDFGRLLDRTTTTTTPTTRTTEGSGGNSNKLEGVVFNLACGLVLAVGFKFITGLFDNF